MEGGKERKAERKEVMKGKWRKKGRGRGWLRAIRLEDARDVVMEKDKRTLE